MRGELAIVGTDGPDEGFLWAFDRETGAVRWTVPAGRGFASGLAELDGLLYAGSLEEELLCLDLESGATAWSFSAESGEDVRTGHLTPVLAEDTVIWGSAGSQLYALDAGTGESRWREYLSAPLRTNPLLRDGDVFVGTEDGFVHRLNAGDGESLDLWFVGGDPYGDIVPAAGLLLLFVDWMEPAGELVALDPVEGEIRWRQPSPQEVSWTSKRPFLLGDRVLVGTEDGRVYVFDVHEGTPTLLLGGLERVVRSFAIDDDALYVGSSAASITRRSPCRSGTPGPRPTRTRSTTSVGSPARSKRDSPDRIRSSATPTGRRSRGRRTTRRSPGRGPPPVRPRTPTPGAIGSSGR